MDHPPDPTNVSDVACPRCGRDWLRLWALPDETRVYICDECRAVWAATDELVTATFTYYADFMQGRGLDPAADVFTPVAQPPPRWGVITTPD